jgi:L-malate glycosyltransferase
VICNLDRGGTETQVVELAQRLNSSHCRVTVAALQGTGPLRATLHECGIRVVDFPKETGLLSLRSLYEFLRLVGFLRKERFTVVHSHDLWSNLVAVPAARVAGTPVIFSSQRDLAHLYWYTPFRRRIIGFIHRWATGVTVNSLAVSELVQKEFHVPLSRIRVIRNGVAFERFSSSSADRKKLVPAVGRKDKLILTVANMHTPSKGHLDLIEAVRQLIPLYPDAKFVLVGDGAERLNIERRARESGVQEAMVFLGQCANIPELLACSDLFVLPSRAEGLPNSLLEAMASGVAVVATAVGGVPEVIQEDVNGVLVPPQNPARLANAILRLLRDPEFAKRIGLAAREHVRTGFNFDRVVAELESAYQVSKLNESIH